MLVTLERHRFFKNWQQGDHLLLNAVLWVTMPIGGSTIFSMKISHTATKLNSVACVAFFTYVFHQMVAQTTFQVNTSFVKGSILRDWTDFSDACDFHCKNLRKTSKSVWNSVVWQGHRFWRWSMMHQFLMKRWHSCFQKVVKMHEFLCEKRYFCQVVWLTLL